MHSLPVSIFPILISVVALHYDCVLFLGPFSSHCPPIDSSSMAIIIIIIIIITINNLYFHLASSKIAHCNNQGQE